jgi:predicted transcriptional regulator
MQTRDYFSYKLSQVTKTKRRVKSNREKIESTVSRYPGLRFHQIKSQTKIANGTVQHHLDYLVKENEIIVNYQKKIPRYYANNVENTKQIILLRLRQNTTSKIIKALLKNECQTFGQMVKFTKKSPGTVSVYKNMLLKDGIIIGNTNSCQCNKSTSESKIKYRLSDSDKVRLLVQEYGKSSLKRSADNLADIFLSL